MYYIAMFMCTITDILAVITLLPALIVVAASCLLHEWQATLQEQREQEDKGGGDG